MCIRENCSKEQRIVLNFRFNQSKFSHITVADALAARKDLLKMKKISSSAPETRNDKNSLTKVKVGIETVKKSRKNQNIHFDLQILPTRLNYWIYIYKGPNILKYRKIRLLEEYFLLLKTFYTFFVTYINFKIYRY